MLLDPRYRFFLRHEMQFRSFHDHGEPLELINEHGAMDVSTILRSAIADGRANLTLRNQDVFRLTRFEIFPNRNIAALLFRRGDPDATIQMYEHQPTGRLRKADKTAEDAVVVSAHMFVSLRRVPGRAPSYPVIVEEVPGVSKTYMRTLLHDLVRAVKYEYQPGRGDPKQTYTLVDLVGIKADRIGDAEGGAVIDLVELVREPEIGGLDVEGIEPRRQRMQIKIRAETRDKIGAVQRIRDWANGTQWGDMKVRIELPNDRSRLVPMARDADAADILFVKAKRVDVARPLDQCTDEISQELMENAVQEFAA